MPAEVDQVHGLSGHGTRGLLADEGEHAAVVVRIGVDVEQAAPAEVGDRSDDLCSRPSLMLTTHSSITSACHPSALSPCVCSRPGRG